MSRGEQDYSTTENGGQPFNPMKIEVNAGPSVHGPSKEHLLSSDSGPVLLLPAFPTSGVLQTRGIQGNHRDDVVKNDVVDSSHRITMPNTAKR